MLSAISTFRMANVYITNLVKCGLNDKDGRFKGLGSFNEECVKNCYHTILSKELAIVQPKVIFAVGSAVADWLHRLPTGNAFIQQLPHPAGRRRGFRDEHYKALYFWLVVRALHKVGIIQSDESCQLARTYLEKYESEGDGGHGCPQPRGLVQVMSSVCGDTPACGACTMVKRAGQLEQRSFSIDIVSDSEALSSELALAFIPDLERRRGDCLPPIELPPNPTDMSSRVRFHDNWIFDFPGYREQKFHRAGDARLVVLSKDPWDRRVARLAADRRTLTPGRIISDLGIAVSARIIYSSRSATFRRKVLLRQAVG